MRSSDSSEKDCSAEKETVKMWRLPIKCQKCESPTSLLSLCFSADGAIAIESHCPRCGADDLNILSWEKIALWAQTQDCAECRRKKRENGGIQ